MGLVASERVDLHFLGELLLGVEGDHTYLSHTVTFVTGNYVSVVGVAH